MEGNAGSWFADFSSSPWAWRVTQASNTAGTLSAGCSRRPSLSLVTCPHYQTRSRTVPSQDLHARTTHAETYRRPACLAASSIPIHSHPWFSRPRHDVYAVPVQLSRRSRRLFQPDPEHQDLNPTAASCYLVRFQWDPAMAGCMARREAGDSAGRRRLVRRPCTSIRWAS